MARQVIIVKPVEQGSAIVTIAPTDENGDALLFAELTSPQWQLMKLDGTIINSRSFANCNLTSFTFTLSGDDLAIFDESDNGWRVLAVQATYDSDAGSGLNLKAECEFEIDTLLSVDDEES